VQYIGSKLPYISGITEIRFGRKNGEIVKKNFKTGSYRVAYCSKAGGLCARSGMDGKEAGERFAPKEIC
jgi:hypothetical protein